MTESYIQQTVRFLGIHFQEGEDLQWKLLCKALLKKYKSYKQEGQHLTYVHGLET